MRTTASTTHFLLDAATLTPTIRTATVEGLVALGVAGHSDSVLRGGADAFLDKTRSHQDCQPQ